MAETGKTTGNGYPIHTNTSIPSRPHESSSTPEQKHIDMQEVDDRGSISRSDEGQHLTDEGSVSWGKEAHGEGKK